MALRTCSACGRTISDKATECIGCGAKVVRKNFIICGDCESFFDESLSACPNCGCPVSEVASQNLFADFDNNQSTMNTQDGKSQFICCSRCGSRNEPTARFCIKCGELLLENEKVKEQREKEKIKQMKYTLAGKIKLVDFLWLAVGILQIISFFVYMKIDFTKAIIVGIFGIINIVVAVEGISFANEGVYDIDFSEACAKYEVNVGVIVMYLYNAIIIIISIITGGILNLLIAFGALAAIIVDITVLKSWIGRNS